MQDKTILKGKFLWSKNSFVNMKVGFKMGRDFICNRAFFFFFCKGCSKLNFYFCRSRILFVQNRIIQCHSVSPQFLRHCEPASTATDDQKVMCTKPFEQGPLEIQGCFPFSLLNAGELPCISTFLATSSLGGEHTRKMEGNPKAR